MSKQLEEFHAKAATYDMAVMERYTVYTVQCTL